MILDLITRKPAQVLEGHTGGVRSVSFSADGDLLASKSRSDTLYLWNTRTWEVVATLYETYVDGVITSVSFHPTVPRLATLGDRETVIRIWDIETDHLFHQAATDSVRYTTAKLVLVGDSGVGKTGLGWRLAHNTFREHSSTHGQQFWVIDDLCQIRDDGTECEAVLWDLAGQHVYRPIHSIFLDNVDASLVLFDPSNRQDPLKGAKFWLEQLKGNKQLPPSLLVGARMDRGGSTLSQEYLDQFCQQYGINGGYVGTSAKTGEGLDKLIQQIKSQIPWDEMTTTNGMSK
ncbi:MAG: GTP-binding protein [Xenococcaceae cyanobacterium MO_207.B15]|nr:GTP-binding protein [Xenococcaceae cyanobacterium MO_207.B15]